MHQDKALWRIFLWLFLIARLRICFLQTLLAMLAYMFFQTTPPKMELVRSCQRVSCQYWMRTILIQLWVLNLNNQHLFKALYMKVKLIFWNISVLVFLLSLYLPNLHWIMRVNVSTFTGLNPLTFHLKLEVLYPSLNLNSVMPLTMKLKTW